MKNSKLLLPLFLVHFLYTIGYSASYNSFENKTVPNQNFEILILHLEAIVVEAKKQKNNKTILKKIKKGSRKCKNQIKTNIKQSDDTKGVYWDDKIYNYRNKTD